MHDMFFCKNIVVTTLTDSHEQTLSVSPHRLAFSCIWEMNHSAEILKTRFTKSAINSKVSFMVNI